MTFEEWEDWPYEHAPWSLLKMYTDWREEREKLQKRIQELEEQLLHPSTDSDAKTPPY